MVSGRRPFAACLIEVSSFRNFNPSKVVKHKRANQRLSVRRTSLSTELVLWKAKQCCDVVRSASTRSHARTPSSSFRIAEFHGNRHRCCRSLSGSLVLLFEICRISDRFASRYLCCLIVALVISLPGLSIGNSAVS